MKHINIKEPGLYYGQCSELCGIGHGFMPISIKAVTADEVAVWLDDAKEEFAENNTNEIVLK